MGFVIASQFIKTIFSKQQQQHGSHSFLDEGIDDAGKERHDGSRRERDRRGRALRWRYDWRGRGRGRVVRRGRAGINIDGTGAGAGAGGHSQHVLHELRQLGLAKLGDVAEALEERGEVRVGRGRGLGFVHELQQRHVAERAGGRGQRGGDTARDGEREGDELEGVHPGGSRRGDRSALGPMEK